LPSKEELQNLLTQHQKKWAPTFRDDPFKVAKGIDIQ
jgi:hypothetical protein